MTLLAVRAAVWRGTKFAVFLVVLAYVGRELLMRIAQMPLRGTLHYDYLLAGAAFAALSSALFAPIYLAMQEALGSQAGLRAATLVALISPVGKYLPGKVGSLVGAIWIYRAFRVGPILATEVTFLAAAATFAAISLLLLPFIASNGLARLPSDPLRWLVISLWLGGLMLAFPRLFVILVNQMMSLIGRAPLELSIRYAAYLRGVIWTLIQCLLMGTAFWLVANAVGPVAPSDWYLMTASLLVAGIVGFFAFFAPAGIGVREGVLLLLLSGVMSDSGLALAVVLIRVNQILVEITLALTGGAIWRWIRCRPP